MPGPTVQPANPALFGGTSYVESHSSYLHLDVAPRIDKTGLFATGTLPNPSICSTNPQTFLKPVPFSNHSCRLVFIRGWNRTKQNDFRKFRNWAIAPEALTTMSSQAVRFSGFGLSTFFRHSTSAFVERRVL